MILLHIAGLVSGCAALLMGPQGTRAARTVTALFLLSTLATGVDELALPAGYPRVEQVVGALMLLVLIASLIALWHRLAGPWRRSYVAAAGVALACTAFIAILREAELVALVVFVVAWLLLARPPSVRPRTLAVRQPRAHRLRFLPTTNRRSFQ
jgi:protein-S-isoprenylcysteine O-methyltransferase Ste14